ncbi:MAG: baseplate J/gp47 family protein [Myxococcales bacterium]|nr:baseplate J/gp47 family protein [Myxococcales bacterium]
MPEIFGLTSKGFKAKDFNTIKEEIEQEMRRTIDPSLHCGPTSIAGQITAIVALQARQVWESASGLYHSLQPHSASGHALDSLCSLTGVYRRMPRYTKACVTLEFDSQASLPAGTTIKSIDGFIFKLENEIKNESQNPALLEAIFIAQGAGEVLIHKNTQANILNPVVGWNKATFKEGIEIGALKEEDASLRLRRQSSLKSSGSSTKDSIRARLLMLPDVEEVHIKEDKGSFETFIKGGKDDDIAQTLWQCKPIGVQTVGGTTCLVKDSLKQSRQINFSRPEIIELSLLAIISVSRLLDDSELNELKTDILTHAQKHFKLGAEIYSSRFYGILLSQHKVLDVKQLNVIEIPNRTLRSEFKEHQIATLEFNNITITQQLEEHQ